MEGVHAEEQRKSEREASVPAQQTVEPEFLQYHIDVSRPVVLRALAAAATLSLVAVASLAASSLAASDATTA